MLPPRGKGGGVMEYPYDIGDKVISECYPLESKRGGVIDYVDCGELHSLIAKFYDAVIKELEK